MARLNYQESIKFLQAEQWQTVDEFPSMPARMPHYDDEDLGFSFFRTVARDGKLDNLTLPRTYFGRSKLKDMSFRNTGLSESAMCWNDFIGVDFTGACLRGCDMRASVWEECSFAGADLSYADLRLSTFTKCDFSQAFLTGTRITRSRAGEFPLSEKQRLEVDWQDEEGESPAGG